MTDNLLPESELVAACQQIQAEVAFVFECLLMSVNVCKPQSGLMQADLENCFCRWTIVFGPLDVFAFGETLYYEGGIQTA
jgi:hypothetical protein